MRERQPLRHSWRQRRRLPRRIGDEAIALIPVAELRGIALDLIDAVVIDGADHVQALAELHSSCEPEFAAEATDISLRRAGGGRGFQAFELAIEHEVDDA